MREDRRREVDRGDQAALVGGLRAELACRRPRRARRRRSTAVRRRARRARAARRSAARPASARALSARRSARPCAPAGQVGDDQALLGAEARRCARAASRAGPSETAATCPFAVGGDRAVDGRRCPRCPRSRRRRGSAPRAVPGAGAAGRFGARLRAACQPSTTRARAARLQRQRGRARRGIGRGGDARALGDVEQQLGGRVAALRGAT